MDLDTGAEVFTAETTPQTFVVDFDGRYVVVSQSLNWYAQPVSIIYDIEGEFDSLLVPDGAALVHSTLPGDG